MIRATRGFSVTAESLDRISAQIPSAEKFSIQSSDSTLPEQTVHLLYRSTRPERRVANPFHSPDQTAGLYHAPLLAYFQ